MAADAAKYCVRVRSEKPCGKRIQRRNASNWCDDCRDVWPRGDVPATEPCFSCGGKGSAVLEVTEVSNGKAVTSKHATACFVCKGAKVLPLGEGKRIQDAEKAFWCGCEVSEPGAFHDDGECGDCRKHHWHCGRCGKIAQVG